MADFKTTTLFPARHYGSPIFYELGEVIHACAGAEVMSGQVLLWTACEKHDVPAGKGFTSKEAKVTCAACAKMLAEVQPVA